MRKLCLLTLLVLLNLCLPLLVLEWAYRTQILDTYRPELQAFNPAQVTADASRPTLLLLGDSFTAGRTSYAGLLQDTLQEWRGGLYAGGGPRWGVGCVIGSHRRGRS